MTDIVQRAQNAVDHVADVREGLKPGTTAMQRETAASEWNPHYAAYAREHGRSPEKMLEYDRERCPGGCMGEFMIWISQRWSEWRRINGRRDEILSERDRANFREWLANRPKEGESQNST